MCSRGEALRNFKSHTDRTLMAEVDGIPGSTVPVVNFPRNVAPSEEVEKFYEDLQNVLRDVPAHNFPMVLGVFNARLGPEDVPFTYHDTTNRNGALLAELLSETGFLADNTLLKKRGGKMWT